MEEFFASWKGAVTFVVVTVGIVFAIWRTKGKKSSGVVNEYEDET